jgi:hypothetical protein
MSAPDPTIVDRLLLMAIFASLAFLAVLGAVWIWRPRGRAVPIDA